MVSVLFSFLLGLSASANVDFSGPLKWGASVKQGFSKSSVDPNAQKEFEAAYAELQTASKNIYISDQDRLKAVENFRLSALKYKEKVDQRWAEKSYWQMGTADYQNLRKEKSRVDHTIFQAKSTQSDYQRDRAKEQRASNSKPNQAINEFEQKRDDDKRIDKPKVEPKSDDLIASNDPKKMSPTSSTVNLADANTVNDPSVQTPKSEGTGWKPTLQPETKKGEVSKACQDNFRKCTDDDKNVMKKATQEKNTARCYYAGFQGFDSGGKCKPASDDPELAKKQAGPYGDKLDCKGGKSLLPCNPMVFGLAETGKAICVPRSKDATKKCEDSSLIAKADCTPEQESNPKTSKRCTAIKAAKDAYTKEMQDKSAQDKFKELSRSVVGTCGNSLEDHKAIVQSEASNNVGKSASRLTKDGKVAESSAKDYFETCSVLKNRMTLNADNLIWSRKPATVVAEPVKSGPGYFKGVN